MHLCTYSTCMVISSQITTTEVKVIILCASDTGGAMYYRGKFLFNLIQYITYRKTLRYSVVRFMLREEHDTPIFLRYIINQITIISW
jgi:hypothetical protein